MRKSTLTKILLLVLLALLSGCNLSGSGPDPTPNQSASPTPAPPTLTPVPPSAAIVNGEKIALTSYQASLLQFEAALTQNPNLLAQDETAQDKVLSALIERQILSQAARAAGFTADEQIVAERITKLAAEIGGEEALLNWIAANGYTPESFTVELILEIEAAWQRDQIANSVPTSAEQIEARQALYYNQAQAESAYNDLLNGASFDVLIVYNDQGDRGYLEWFPRGYLLIPAVEEAAFALQPGQYSQVIGTEIGYLIIQVLDRDPNRPLAPGALRVLQTQAVQNWLAAQTQQSQIEISLP